MYICPANNIMKRIRKAIRQWLSEKQSLYFVIWSAVTPLRTTAGAKQVLSFSKLLAELTYRWHYGMFPFSMSVSRLRVLGVVSEEEVIRQVLARDDTERADNGLWCSMRDLKNVIRASISK
jgi:hypothetical protein